MRTNCFVLCGLALALAASAGAAQVGAPVEVAPRVAGTRSQSWASLAWSEEAKGWLVVWREGLLNEKVSDIWCARVSEGGKALDPAGIRLTEGKGLKDRPRVASDGKGFLVVWEDLRSGKDWDVYGARVSGEGKVLDANGFLVAGGAHNQCRPDVTFAGGCYHVAWQAFTGKEIPGFDGTGYGLWGARVSPAGRLLDGRPRELVSNRGSQAAHPSLAGGDNALILAYVQQTYNKWGGASWNRALLSPETGQVKVGPTPYPRGRSKEMSLGNKVTPRRGPVAWGGGGFLTAVRIADGPDPYAAKLYRVTPSGETQAAAVLHGRTRGHVHHAPPVCSIGFDGEKYLVAMECRVGRDDRWSWIEIRGWYVSPDGKVLDGDKLGFTVAPVEQHSRREQVLPAVCGGPKGVSLVVNSDLRGADDLKLVARVVRAK